MKKKLIAACLISAFSVSSPVSAETFIFKLSGDYTASWKLSSSGSPDTSTATYALFKDVYGVYGGHAGFADFYVFTAPWGGFTLEQSNYELLVDALGPTLFSGATSAPQFLPGTYSLTGDYQPGDYTLTISAAVPEPAAWALMIAGFGAVGLSLRQRKAFAR